MSVISDFIKSLDLYGQNIKPGSLDSSYNFSISITCLNEFFAISVITKSTQQSGCFWDSFLMIGFDPQKVAELINLPKDHMIGMMLVIGKTKTPASPRGGQLSLDEVVNYDSF